ncbi:MAG TPA: hypothetical protein VHE57_10895 [Mycobacteriales bacterium]|nr:hypothetical protein [Mycobacteriales bacterium]
MSGGTSDNAQPGNAEAAGKPGLLTRTGAFALLTAGPVGGVFLGLTIAHSRSDYSEVVPFGGWQPTLVDAALAFVCLMLLVVGYIGLRRFAVPPGTSTAAQVVATVVALAVGTGAGALGDLGGKHVLRWASHHTTTAHRYARLERLAAGDATHRPVAFRVPGEVAAPASLARPLLTPADLGPDWQYDWNPGVTYNDHPIKPVDQPAATYTMSARLAARRWTGSSWSYDQMVSELATRYTSRADARRAVKVLTGPSTLCCTPTPGYRADHIDGRLVWRYDSTGRYSAPQAIVQHGSLVVRIVGGLRNAKAPESRSFTSIVRLAVKRLGSSA